ncbi:hypothetical protein [Citrobacter werkmanii]|uniref:hypothetical protein n=1 Tax=Citrobacter werkmanii TaxID=67827 RepID=UPI00300CB24A
METISFEVIASDVTVKPDDYSHVRVEIDGVKISDLLESIEDNDSVIDSIGGEDIAEYFSTEGRLFDFLNHFDCGDLIDYLRTRSWELAHESED